MKVGIFLACLVAAASAVIYDKDVITTTTVPMTVDQKFINLILRHNWQPLVIKEYREFIDTPILDETKYESLDIYKKYIFHFFDLYKHGLVMPRGRVGSLFDYKFNEQTMHLFYVFYYSIDTPTLFHNIIWARENVNELMFIHALHLLIFHHETYNHIVLPPLYEILPHHFFTYDVIQKGIDYKLGGLWKLNSTFYTYTDYTSRFYLDKFDEQYLTYFTEDIGLNSFYYYFYMRYPMWMRSEKSDLIFGFDKEPVGELWFYLHQQLLARYYLERVSNDMGMIYEFTWVKGIKNGYWPMLRYKNGMEFSYRSDFYGLDSMKSEYYDLVHDWEMRIRQMIDSGYITLGDKKYDIYDHHFIDILGHLIVGNVHETRFYRYVLFFYHMLLGGRGTVEMDSYWYVPSVMENFETMLRDPVFYQLYYRIVQYWLQYKNLLPMYKVEDLYVPVKINDVVVGPLKTYFEYDTIDATNVIDLDLVDTTYDFNFYIRQPRLNYEPFDVKLLLDVETAGDYTVRFFLGPKILNRYELDKYRHFFFELDHFITKLTVGKNTIVRNSKEFLYFFRDLIKYTTTGDYKYVEEYGFPKGLLLPKGKVGGMPFTFYVIVHKNDDMQYLGFPFDRQIDILNFFVPNMYFKDVLISQFVDYDLFSESPLNNIYWNDKYPMDSIRVPLNVDYYKDNKLDYYYWHTNDVYYIWYKKYMNYGIKDKYYGKHITKDIKYRDDYLGTIDKTVDYNKFGYKYPMYNKKFDYDTKYYDTDYYKKFDKDVYDKYTPTFKKDTTYYDRFPIIKRVFGAIDY